MKPRKVIVILELNSQWPLEELRDKDYWQEWLDEFKLQNNEINEVLQVQANVVKEKKK